jgi:EpsD family peptidyl-prolyl cis-trans isomerase
MTNISSKDQGDNNMTVSKSFIRFGVALMLAGALGACGKSEKKETQVVAKVDGQEITVHQLNFALARAGIPSDGQATEQQKQALHALIDQQLLVNKAMESKLDRDPNVLQALEAVKSQVLAQAYLEHMAGQSSPSSQEVKDYFNGHPELFANRRIYRLQELQASVDPKDAETVAQQQQQSKSLGDLGAWLKSRNIPFSLRTADKKAEDLPLSVLPKLAQMKEGDMLSLPVPNGLEVIQVVSYEEQPLTEEQATPLIQHFLVNKNRSDMAKEELQKLRDSAKIEYVGEFSKLAEDKPAAAPAAKDAK